MSDELPAERLLRQLRGIPHAPRASQYSGVTWHVVKGKWCARLSYDGKAVYRICDSEEEAARIYDVAVDLIYGKMPRENWPPNCPAAKPANFDGNPPVGICRAKIKQWLIDAGLL